GYADARVRPRIQNAGSQQVRISYDLSEGRKSYIGKIDITGNDKTKDKVIRRELSVEPAQEFNTVKLRTSRRRLENLNYFQGVEVLPTDALEPGYKDITINVAEKQTGSFSFGAGFSSVDNLVGFIDVAQSNFDLWGWPNFTGGGQQFRAGLKWGTRRKDFVMSLHEPWFLGQKLDLGGELFYRENFYLSNDYAQRNIGGAISLRKPIGPHSYLRAELRPQQVEIFDVDSDASPEIKAEEDTYFQNKVSLDYVHDTRDSSLLTRTGHQFSLGTSLSGGFLGGDVDVYGLNAGFKQYVHLPGDTIFSISTNINVVDSWSNGDQVPIFDRLFVGGAFNLRGFDYRDVGPKDASGEPLGGLTSAHFTAEYTFPIIERVRGAVFYDVGFVNEDAFDFSACDYTADVGFGLRVFLPGDIPLRLDYGIPI
ncbi:MAG: BamA/TamA family outer membrane protein, partial [Verrucomicrobiota bacterium]